MTDSRTGPPLVLASGPGDGVAVLTLNRPEKKNALSIAGFDLRKFAVAGPGHQERPRLSSDLFHHTERCSLREGILRP